MNAHFSASALRYCALGLAIAVAVAYCQPAMAQFPGSGLGPYSDPVMSPWFDLYRRDAAPLPNYYMFVRPRLQTQRALDFQRATTYSQQQTINTLGQQLSNAQNESIAPTGSSATFMNYSHYYPAPRTFGSR